MIKYFVRTTGERALDESFSQIEYELLVDTEHKFPNIFVEQLRIINEHDSVLMEDDIILCKDFKNRIEEVISRFPKDLINFFTFPTMRMEKLSMFTGKSFCYNQCTYFPKGYGKKIADTIEENHFNDGKNTPEKMMKLALDKLNLTGFNIRPCLVQHLDNGSLIGNECKCNHRRSPFFIDYLDELGITYDDVKLSNNEKKLFDLVKEKFKEVDSK